MTTPDAIVTISDPIHLYFLQHNTLIIPEYEYRDVFHVPIRQNMRPIAFSLAQFSEQDLQP